MTLGGWGVGSTCMMRGSSEESVVAVGLLRVAKNGHVDATARVVANAGCKLAAG